MACWSANASSSFGTSTLISRKRARRWYASVSVIGSSERLSKRSSSSC